MEFVSIDGLFEFTVSMAECFQPLMSINRLWFPGNKNIFCVSACGD